MEIQLGEYNVKCEIIHKNNKNIYFRFNEDGILSITCNRFVSSREIEKLIKKNEKSLLRLYANYLHKQEIDSKYHYLGDSYTIIFDENVKKINIIDDNLYAKDEKMLAKWEKNECIRIFQERINAILNNFTNIPNFSLRIRKMKTRWGVNNVTKRIITLNSELLKKDVTLIDYVIIHELCHFYYANHSSNFWTEVEKRYPYYKLARKRLRVE
ncbi:MAG TPA: hypothetical protein DCE23_07465 [Firmicutes bacterium]|nr:hypothetical protein [Bacillota bacterium]